MDSSTNFDNPLQIETTSDPWVLNEQEPTTLVALYPGDQPPTLDKIAQLAKEYLAEPLNIVKHLETDDPKVIFNTVVELPFLQTSALIFAEPAQPLSPMELDDPSAIACKWVIGIDALLDECDAHLNFVELMRFIAKLVPDCPAILDVNCERWLSHDVIDKNFFNQIDGVIIDPPEDVLWLVQVIGHKESKTAWVHTHGLWRCGNPELEMLQVPIKKVPQACELINTIAERLLEERPPDTDSDMQIGPQMDITFQPWQKIAPLLAPNLPGSMTDRTDESDNTHTGVRAVICSSISSSKSPKKCKTYPVDVIKILSRNEVALFPAIRVADRLADLARAAWPTLVHEFNTLPKQLLRTNKQLKISDKIHPVGCLIKACLTPESDPAKSPEHLWYIVYKFEDDRAQAQLIQNPLLEYLPSELALIWIDLKSISDWSVVTHYDSYGPSQLEEISETFNKLKQGIAT